MMRARHRIAIVFGAFLLCAAPVVASAAAPDVETSVYTAHVDSGEPITLQIRVRGAALQNQPDLSPLAHDFEVLDVHQTRRTSIINGTYDHSVDYIIALAARREGDLVIPALPVGDATTDPIAVTVNEGPVGVAESEAEPEVPAEPVRIDVHVDRADPYEQERAVLRIELYAAGDVLEGALSAPEVAGAVVEPIGEDRKIEKEIDGSHYSGIERTYTIVPEKSGELVVAPIRFEGSVRVQVPRGRERQGSGFHGSLFERFFGNGALGNDLLEHFFGTRRQRVSLASKPQTLHVRPRPEGAVGQWWLPARAVTLTERWDPAGASVHIGEPITRSIEIRADGVSPAQLPTLQAGDVGGVKQYAEAPRVKETRRGTVRVDETTLIPTQAGSVTLPAIEIAWWDTQADAMRTASLPARTIEVAPAVTGNDAPAGAGAAKAPAAAAAAPPTPEATHPIVGLAQRLDPRARLALVGLALFLLGFFAARLRRARPSRAVSDAPEPRRAPSQREVERALRRACRRDDPVAAEAAVRGLRQLAGADAARLREPALVAEIARLHAVRYSTQGEAWSGTALWKAWRRARRAQRPKQQSPGLPPLYPTP